MFGSFFWPYDRTPAPTRFCAVNGTLDPFVPRKAMENMSLSLKFDSDVSEGK